MKRTLILAATTLVAVSTSHTPAWAIDPAGQPRTQPINPTTPTTRDPFYGTIPGGSSSGSLGGNNFGSGLPQNNTYSPWPQFGQPNPTTPTTTPTTQPNTGRTRGTTPVSVEDRKVPDPLQYPGLSGNPNERFGLPQYQPNYIAPGDSTTPTKQSRWRLGVYSKDLDTGVKIVQVVPRSAAERARLEANDVIVAINGYQVGYVSGELFDCTSEFDRHATKDGWVNMLVLNHRDGSLVNVPVQLDSRYAKVSGTIALNDRRALSPNATVNVELREIVRPEAPPVTLASAKVTETRKYPLPFEIEFDPMQIDSRRNYVVYANVVENNRTVYESTEQYRVLNPTQPKTVAIGLDRLQNTPTGDLDRNSQIAQIVRWFEDYLGRAPTDRDLLVWISMLERGYTMHDVQQELLGHNQFFNQCDRDKRTYIERLHEVLVGRRPSEAELAYWMSQYDNRGGIRRELVRDFQQAIGVPR